MFSSKLLGRRKDFNVKFYSNLPLQTRAKVSEIIKLFFSFAPRLALLFFFLQSNYSKIHPVDGVSFPQDTIPSFGHHSQCSLPLLTLIQESDYNGRIRHTDKGRKVRETNQIKQLNRTTAEGGGGNKGDESLLCLEPEEKEKLVEQ